MKILKGLKKTIMSPFIFSIIFSGHPISVDGLFFDWDDVPVLNVDTEGDGANADFSTLKVTYDSEFLFIYFNMYDGEFLLQDWNSYQLFIDADNDISTGLEVHGIGAELNWTFGERSGIQYLNNQQLNIGQNDLSLRIAPTITSSEFEIAISRTSLPLTMNNSQTITQGKIVLYEGEGESDYLPDEEGGVSFNIDLNDMPHLPQPIMLERLHENDIRIVSYNTLNEGILDEDRQNHFKRIIQSLSPDVIALQEHSEWDEIDQVIQSWFPNDQWYASWTYRDLVVLSRFQIINDASMISSDRSMVALLNTESELGTNLLVFNSHLSCCANNEERQQQVDEFASSWREWIQNGEGPFELEYETPFIHVGDFNYVGYRQQVETIRVGDILDENQFGNDFLPDWDSTAIVELFPRQSNKRMGYTWRSDGSSFNPGKLDYIFYSDATIDSGKNYILNTLAMDNFLLEFYGLEWNDTQEASDHLPLVFDILINSDVGLNNQTPIIEPPFLYPNYPNPFNSNTKIKLYFPYLVDLDLMIVDLKGKMVKKLNKNKPVRGNYTTHWDGTNESGTHMPSGIYFVLIKTDRLTLKKKMVLLK